MWRAGAVGSPVYTTASVVYDWAGAMIKNHSQNAKEGNGGPTDRPTDTVTHSRVTRD